ncbi:hypothetical protein LTS10_003660 [Elasticomyces elasticus]|nr:hypothetical protein LTS10_003660 [Elasticomyces elasticus]
MPMEYHVLLASQSNQGVDALFKNATEIMDEIGRPDLLDNSVQIRTELLEIGTAQHLASGLPDVAGAQDPEYFCMAQRIHRYIPQFPHDESYEYMQHLRAKREAKNPTPDRPWPPIAPAMRKKIPAMAETVDTSVGASAFFATTLASTEWKRYAAMFDEARQATHDLIMAVVGQPRGTKAVLVGGDPNHPSLMVPSLAS